MTKKKKTTKVNKTLATFLYLISVFKSPYRFESKKKRKNSVSLDTIGGVANKKGVVQLLGRNYNPSPKIVKKKKKKKILTPF